MDKFSKGLIAGMIGDCFKDIPVIITHVIWKIPKIAYWDYASHVGFGKEAKTFVDYAFAFPIQWVFGMSIGVIYVYLLDHFKPKQYLLAGAGLGATTWFILRGLVALYKLEPFVKPDELSAVINWSISILFGLSVAYTNNWLNRKEKGNWK